MVLEETIDRRAQKHLYYMQKKECILERQKQRRVIFKDKVLMVEKNSRMKHKEQTRERIRLWREQNKNYNKQYYENKRTSIISKVNKYIKNNIEKVRAYKRDYYYKNKDHLLLYRKVYAIKNKEKLLAYRKANPHSSKRYSFDLQISMNNVRKRDNNICQWYGCGLTNYDTEIHVNHIFPRKEYPELELIEQYMICYCVDHHIAFHRARKDGYDKFLHSHIKNNFQELM